MKLPDRGIYIPEVMGVTQSLITMWRECPMKALMYLNGYRKSSRSSFALCFGDFFHYARSEIVQAFIDGQIQNYGDDEVIVEAVSKFFTRIKQDYLKASFKEWEPDIILSVLKYAELMLPLYFKYNKVHLAQKWVLCETPFSCYFKGWDIPIIGKMDGGYFTPGSDGKRITLFELKTKARFNLDSLRYWLKLDLQTNWYSLCAGPIMKGVIDTIHYEVVRSPDYKKYKTSEEGLEALKSDITYRPKHYFASFKRPVQQKNLLWFKDMLKDEVNQFSEWYSTTYLQSARVHSGSCTSQFGKCDYLSYCTSYGENTYNITESNKLFTETAGDTVYYDEYKIA